jgi:hypothetical protein
MFAVKNYSFGRLLMSTQGRFFANPTKLSSTRFLQRELTENPEFYKAFPQLAKEGAHEHAQNLQDPDRASPFFQTLLH